MATRSTVELNIRFKWCGLNSSFDYYNLAARYTGVFKGLQYALVGIHFLRENQETRFIGFVASSLLSKSAKKVGLNSDDRFRHRRRAMAPLAFSAILELQRVCMCQIRLRYSTHLYCAVRSRLNVFYFYLMLKYDNLCICNGY